MIVVTVFLLIAPDGPARATFYRCGGLVGKNGNTKPLFPNPSFLPFFMWCGLLLTESATPM